MKGFQSVLTFAGLLPLMQVVIDDLTIQTHTHTPSLSHTHTSDYDHAHVILAELRGRSASLPATDGRCCRFPPTFVILARASRVVVGEAVSDPLPLSVAALSTGAARVYLIRGISGLSGNKRRYLSERQEDKAQPKCRVSFVFFSQHT